MRKEREEYWRAIASGERAGAYARDAAEELLAELSAVRAERDEANRAYETTAKAYNTLNEAFGQAREEGRREVLEWLRANVYGVQVGKPR